MNYRPAGIDDVPAIADLMTAVDPDEPWDPVMWRHRWQEWDATGYPNASHLAERDGRAVAVAEWWYQPPEPGATRYGTLRVATLGPDDGLLAEGLALVESGLRALPVDVLAVNLREHHTYRSDRLAAAGYRRDRLQKWWDLDLRGRRDDLAVMAQASREKVAGQGVRLVTVAEEGGSDELIRRIYEVDTAASRDIPSTVPPYIPPFAAWLRHFGSPSLHRNRMWLAMAGDEVLGMSWLKFPPVRGNVWTDWTGVAREARGRGLARALKLETLLQAIDLGIERVRTSNDEKNAPILHLNAELGYRPVPGERLWLKDA